MTTVFIKNKDVAMELDKNPLPHTKRLWSRDLDYNLVCLGEKKGFMVSTLLTKKQLKDKGICFSSIDDEEL